MLQLKGLALRPEGGLLLASWAGIQEESTMTTPDTEPTLKAVETETDAANQPKEKTAEEIQAEQEALQKLVDQIGAKRATSVIRKAELEKSLKPFQAEIILMQKCLEETFDQSQQSILLLNRRGFATSVICRECGTVVECSHRFHDL